MPTPDDIRWADHARAGLPVWAIHVSHYFYPGHQAWYSHVMVTELAGEDVNLRKQTHIEWGPFDHADDVREWSQLMTDEAFTIPGSPWGSLPRERPSAQSDGAA